jgi:hypothetical protein
MRDHGWGQAIAEAARSVIPGAPQTMRSVDPGAADEALPEFARERLFVLRQRAADLRASIEAAMDTRDDATRQAIELDRAVANLLAPYARGGYQQGEKTPEVVRDRARLDAARDRKDRAVKHIDKLTSTWQPLAQLVERLDRFILGGSVKVAFDAQLPAPPRDETPAATVQRLRAKIGKLRTELGRVEAAQVPVEIALQRAREEIAALAAAGRPQVGALFGRNPMFAKIEWGQKNISLKLHGDAVGVDEKDHRLRRLLGMAAGDTVDTLALLAWRFEREMQDGIAELIKQSGNERDALSAEQQTKRRSELESEILICERQKCEAIERAEAAGAPILIRADIDPRALLRLN